jgi:hypothetical protein
MSVQLVWEAQLSEEEIEWCEQITVDVLLILLQNPTLGRVTLLKYLEIAILKGRGLN